jgi:hypothetical protein
MKNNNLVIGILIGLILSISTLLVFMQLDYVHYGMDKIESKFVEQKYFVDSSDWISYCDGKDIPYGDEIIVGNFSWIKEYYRSNQEHSGNFDMRLEKSKLPFFKDKIIFSNWSFYTYGTASSTSINSSREHYHTHPSKYFSYDDAYTDDEIYNNYWRCYFSNIDMGTFSGLISTDDNINYNMLICNYRHDDGTSDIIINSRKDFCGKRYVLNENGSISLPDVKIGNETYPPLLRGYSGDDKVE